MNKSICPYSYKSKQRIRLHAIILSLLHVYFHWNGLLITISSSNSSVERLCSYLLFYSGGSYKAYFSLYTYLEAFRTTFQKRSHSLRLLPVREKFFLISCLNILLCWLKGLKLGFVILISRETYFVGKNRSLHMGKWA